MSLLAHDRGWAALCRMLAIAAALVVLLIVAFVARESWPAWTEIGLARFAADDGWSPAAGDGRPPDEAVQRARFNLLPAVAGSAAVTLGAIVLAGPLGILCGLFTAFGSREWLAASVRRAVELLAGIPSVVFGLWGLQVLVPLIGRIEPPGTSLLAGALVVGLMILPTVALLSDAAFRSFPSEQLAAAAALSLPRSTTLRRIVLPACRRPVLMAVVLAIVRALGETMAVLMVCGNVVQVPKSLFDPVRTLTAGIALEMAYAQDHHRAALFFCGLLLLLIVLALILLTELPGPLLRTSPARRLPHDS